MRTNRTGAHGLAVVVAAAGLAALVAASAGGALAAGAAGKVALRYKFRPGEVQSYSFVQDSKTKTVISGSMVSSVTSTEMGATYTIRKVGKDGSGEIESRIVSMEMDGEGPGMGDLKSVAKAMKAMWFEARVSPTGKFSEIHPHEVPGGMEALAGSLEGMLKAMVVFPDGPVGPGDNWKDEQILPLPLGPGGAMALKLSISYSMRGFKVIEGRKHAIIDATVSITISGDGMAGMKVTATGDGNGSMTFDVDRGLLTSADMIQNMRMTMSAEGMAITMDMEMKSKAKLTGVK